jgi:MFS family permease
VRLIYLLNFLFRLGFQASQPLLGLYLIELGLAPASAGLVMGLAGIIPVSLAPFLGTLADRIGPFRQVVVGGLISIAGYACLALTDSPAFAAVFLMLGWLGSFTTTMAYQAYIAEKAHQGMGVRPFAWLGVTVSLANSLAPAAAGLIAAWGGLPAVFWASAVLSATVFLGLPILRHRAVDTGAAAETKVPLRRWLADVTFVFSVAGALFTGILVGHRNSYLPIHFDSIGFSLTTIGLMLSVQATAGVLVQTQLPRLSRHFSSPVLVVMSFLLAIPALIATPWLRSMGPLVTSMAVLGASSSMLHPLTMALTARAVPGQQQGFALGLRYTALRLGNMVGPPLFGLVAALVSVTATFPAAAGIAALGAAGGWSIMRRGQMAVQEFDDPPSGKQPPVPSETSQTTDHRL